YPLSLQSMISIPVAVHIDFFEWQLELFWFCHRRIYGDDAQRRAHAIVIRRNQPRERAVDQLSWPTDIPHTMCESFFDLSLMPYMGIAAPLNIQAGLLQVLTRFDDEELIEVIDCDMFHLRPASVVEVADDELCVCTVYEDWHLHSLARNQTVIEPYFENGGAFYNGGFVPII